MRAGFFLFVKEFINCKTCGSLSILDPRPAAAPRSQANLPKRQITPFREVRLVLVGGDQSACAFVRLGNLDTFDKIIVVN
jgi:hypothetical protein